MKKIERNCNQCQTPFLAPEKEVKRGGGKFCSRSCSATHQFSISLPPNEKCSWCTQPIRVTDRRRERSKSGLFFCCREHKDLSARLIGGIKEIQPDFYGTGKPNYRNIAWHLNDEIKCNRCSYAKHQEILQVHHKDRDTSNNDISNLEILCPTCHHEDHFLASDGMWGRLSKSRGD